MHYSVFGKGASLRFEAAWQIEIHQEWKHVG